jgi:hypothetical protein
MVIDPDSQTLYTFGGRTISADVSSTVYSGLYAYHVPTKTWKLVRADGVNGLKSRIGHSMLWNPASKELYIFAGQRNKDYLSDFYVYDVIGDCVKEISRDYSVQGG